MIPSRLTYMGNLRTGDPFMKRTNRSFGQIFIGLFTTTRGLTTVIAALFLVGLIVTGLACSTIRPTSLTVPLQYDGNSPIFPGALGQAKVFVFPIDDKRQDTTKIGENTEKAPAV